MSNTPDLSKIVQLIMENPELVDTITKLMTSEDRPEDSSEPKSEPTVTEPRVLPPTVAASAEIQGKRERRTRLLSALKPYMSGERAKAIDSMLTIVDVLDIMKTR